MRRVLLASLATALALQAQPSPQRFTLPNGLRVIHLEDHEHPVVRVRLHLGLEPGDTPPGRQGLPLLAMRMFLHSDAADLKAEAFDRLLEDSGIQLRSSTEPGALEWRLAARSRDQDRALSLLADRLLRTVFDPMVLETQRLACWRQVEQLDATPFQRLEAALLQAPDARPTPISLGAITLEDLLAFRAKVFRPDRALLLIHGDVGLEQAKRLVLLSLGSWTAGDPPQPLEPSVPAPPGRALGPVANPLRIPAPGAGLRVQAVLPRPAGLAAEPTTLIALLITGEPTLFPVSIVCRQDCLVATLDAGPEATPAQAWALLQGRLDALRLRGFSASDLEKARSAWAAARSLDSLDAEAQLDAAAAQVLGRGATRDRMKALELDQLNAALRTWLGSGETRRGISGVPAGPGDLATAGSQRRLR
ncbi:MAG: insulinase family protein [Geothrix sp.]|uniref:M16 family metallopeptidase n=1 Tax=Geothrix sp. TaxID=1962974 RepID=UPI0017F9A334|nr:insulinase family protein [Geothrix sp.]NWJ41787.1 insulinase family protein [Geothrix sp.]WIL20235.1 MAG: insulinase family protein [Geothrix sp.]